MRQIIFGVMAASGLACVTQAGPLGPTPYTNFFDTPLLSYTFSNRIHVENFEDGLFNIPFVTQIGGESITPAGGVFTDSVDGDDFTIDGSGTNGRSHYTTNGATGIIYSFSPEFGDGRLPPLAGVVWTDLSGTADVFLEAFDETGLSLGVISAGPLNDGLSTGETAEDRFLGWENPSGISSIHIYQSGSDMEVDHVQFAYPAPEPTTIGMALAAIVFCYCRRA